MSSSYPRRTSSQTPPRAPPAQRAPITILLVAINVAVFLLEEQWGGSTTSRTLASMGAIVDSGGHIPVVATWFAYGYLHIGAFHLGMNMFALWSIGHLLEPALGKGRFFVLYTLSLLGGGLAIANGAPESLTAGASGALFGLLGAICMRMFLRYRLTRAYDERREIRGNIGRILIPNLVISFLPGVSLLGHAGGLVVGIVFVALAWRRDEEPGAARPLMTVAALVLAVATLAAMAAVWSTTEPWRLG